MSIEKTFLQCRQERAKKKLQLLAGLYKSQKCSEEVK